MSRTVSYLRVSTQEQHTENQSVVLNQYAQQNGHTISHEYIDHGISGSKRDRVSLNKMLEDARLGKFSTIYVLGIDRLSRSVKNLIEVVETLNKHNIQIMFHREKIDTKTVTGNFFLTVLGSLYEMERNIMIERINSGISRAKSQGKHCGRPSKINSSLIASVSLLREKGVSIRDIAKTCSIGIGSCYKILSQTGVTPQ